MTTSLKLDATYATFKIIIIIIIIIIKLKNEKKKNPKNDDDNLWGVATTFATKKTNTKQRPFKLKNKKGDHKLTFNGTYNGRVLTR